jgi:hypothetical protein
MKAVYKLTGQKAKPLLVDAIESYAAKIAGKKTIPDAERMLAKSVVAKAEGYTSDTLANLMLASMDEYLPEFCNVIPYAFYMQREEVAALDDDFEMIDDLISDYAYNELKSLQSKGALELPFFIAKWWPVAVESV